MITVGLYGITDTTHGADPTWTHDHGVAVMRGGTVLSVVELERWTGRKHDNRLPRFIHEILDALVPPDEAVRFVSVNSFAGSTFLSADGNLRIEPDGKVVIGSILTPARVRWFPDGMTRRAAEGWIMSHEFAHLASILPFTGRFEPGALLAHIDGGASDSAASFWEMTAAGPRLIEASWNRLKTPVNNFNVNPLVRAILGFEACQHLAIPGQLMGYAGWGQPRPEMCEWLAENGWFLDRTDNHRALLSAINERFRTDHVVFRPHEPLFRDLCASIQAFFEAEVVGAIRQEAERIGAHGLFYAGGAGLNIPTNVKLELLFDRVHIPPATNDSGLALGAAAWLEYLEHGSLQPHGPFLNRFSVPTEAPSEADIPEVAELLAAGKVVGVCNGAAEVGPRALGHRSILARADDVDLRRKVSEHLKQREWYRPLAPVIAAEVAAEVLGPDAGTSALAPFMLGAWPVRAAWRGALQGVMHADGTVRAQVIHAGLAEDEWLRHLLFHLRERYGLPGLINTSFNPRGRAIVHRHEDAIPLARSMGLDAVVVHGSLHRP
ncbi:MAG TPA: carbamoyltransferase C-terminal domain-containing protein [Polyangia bacterium]|jgi:carbamoyltransferase